MLAMVTWPFRGVPANPSAWLFRVARNKAIDVPRRSKRFIYVDVASHDVAAAAWSIARQKMLPVAEYRRKLIRSGTTSFARSDSITRTI